MARIPIRKVRGPTRKDRYAVRCSRYCHPSLIREHTAWICNPRDCRGRGTAWARSHTTPHPLHRRSHPLAACPPPDGGRSPFRQPHDSRGGQRPHLGHRSRSVAKSASPLIHRARQAGPQFPRHGLGIRKIRDGWLYSVSGLDAVEIETTDEEVIRLGTVEPHRRARTLKSANTVVSTETLRLSESFLRNASCRITASPLSGTGKTVRDP